MRALQVRLIETPMASARTFGPEADAADAERILANANFDQAPVINQGRVVGLVQRDNLRDVLTVREAIRELGSGLLLSGDTPIVDVPKYLLSEPFLFVVSRSEITGFVTAWDLNRQPARTHFYLLLADLEMALAAAVRRRHRHTQMVMLTLLTDDRANKIRARFQRARRLNREADVASFVDFQDLIDIVGADEALRRRLGYGNSQDWLDATSGLGSAREGVMHLTGDLVGGKLTLEELVSVEGRARNLLVAVGTRRLAGAFEVRPDNPVATQRVTEIDRNAGRIRLPRGAKSLFPAQKSNVPIVLRGQSISARYDPRLGPDRERSAVLFVGRDRLTRLVRTNERLFMSKRGRAVHFE